ncbi:tRNA (adenosine(37)-N6)-threonylcarbamoyltransferase complex ATPase subunit type 1 TsaE [Aquabacterium sp.]|uniref:tRNA (adenosine(37)-N6)-threonylcarbamoyltransferase complex ATPase subunit type 1 TsaE n=1 Tax=Aquabacterium sp. TaxID=1872578 RepID=UPI0035B4685B
MTHVTIVASPNPLIERQFNWADETACAATAQSLAAVLRPRLQSGQTVFIELNGTLGAGKTTFTRHLLRALGVQGRIKSPSYAVVEPHELPDLAVHHFDFYRFNDPQEWEDAGFRDLFAAPGLKLVEWPDKAAGLLPRPDLRLHIEPVSETERRVQLQAGTPLGQTLMMEEAAP